MTTYAPHPATPTARGRDLSRRRTPRIPAAALPPATVAVGLIAYLICQPMSLDLAAAEYRAALFGHTGFALWDLQWYGGHFLPAYSVIVPALSWLLGVRWLGALSVLVATVLCGRLVRPRDGASIAAVTCFGLGALASLLSGRITFTAGIPVALAAVLIDTRGRGTVGSRVAVLALSAVVALFSPIASLFLAVVWAARLLTGRRAFYAGALIATFAPILALNLAFPETGAEPMSAAAVLPVVVVAGALIAFGERRHRTVKVAVVIYVAACVLTAMLQTPVGSNVLRLGPLCGASLAAFTIGPRRRWLAVTLAAALLVWQWSPAVHDVESSVGQPSTSASYYQPLVSYLDRVSGPAGEAAGGGFRIEIPFTALHWEARWVAPRYALARGWERQVDVADNPLFYRGRLTDAAYDRWLHANAVRYVALPATRLDYSADQERRIIDSDPGFLRRVWSNPDWQVDAVRRPTPLVSGPGRLISLSSDAIVIAMPQRGTDLIRVRWNPYWAIERGSGCVSAAGRWTQLRATGRETVRIGERFSFSRILRKGPRCTGAARAAA